MSRYLLSEKLPCPYTHAIFDKAATIFESLRHAPRSDDESYHVLLGQRYRKLAADQSDVSTTLSFASSEEKRLTHELVHTTLKYQYILERLVLDTAFFVQHPHLLEVEPLVMVMLCDSQQRKFQPLPCRNAEISSDDIVSVDQAIRSVACKLNAALARIKIDSNVRCIDDLLPDTSRAKWSSSQSTKLVHAWINQLQANKDSVIRALAQDSYHQTDCDDIPRGRTYRFDTLCDDTIIFPSDSMKELMLHSLVKNGHLVLQDYTSCLAACAMRDVLKADCDVVHIDDGNGSTSAHIASLMKERGLSGRVLRFSACRAKPEDDVVTKERLRLLGAANVEFLDESILEMEPSDTRLAKAQSALMSANCSKTSVVNPILFLLTDSEDIKLLKYSTSYNPPMEDFSKRLADLQSQLRWLLSLPSINEVVYMTRSGRAAENEDCISKAIDHTSQTATAATRPFRSAALFQQTTQTIFETAIDKFARLTPSASRNGCFIAALRREAAAESPKESPKDVLAKAAALGLLDSGDRAAGHLSPKHVAKARSSPLARRKPKKSNSLVVAFGSGVLAKHKDRKKT